MATLTPPDILDHRQRCALHWYRYAPRVQHEVFLLVGFHVDREVVGFEAQEGDEVFKELAKFIALEDVRLKLVEREHLLEFFLPDNPARLDQLLVDYEDLDFRRRG